jgi:hypothetical protein
VRTQPTARRRSYGRFLDTLDHWSTPRISIRSDSCHPGTKSSQFASFHRRRWRPRTHQLPSRGIYMNASVSLRRCGRAVFGRVPVTSCLTTSWLKISAPAATDDGRTAAAVKIWMSANRQRGQPLNDTYLLAAQRSRCLQQSALRPGVTAQQKRPVGRDGGGRAKSCWQVVTVHRTFLTGDGQKPPVEPVKMALCPHRWRRSSARGRG